MIVLHVVNNEVSMALYSIFGYLKKLNLKFDFFSLSYNFGLIELKFDTGSVLKCLFQIITLKFDIRTFERKTDFSFHF